MEIPYKREKAANYSMEENMVLYNLYKQNYHLYHSKVENGNRKEGARIRETLLYEWCRILSALGVARREPSKVAEKIKKDFQTARYMINNYRQQLMNGPSGELLHPRVTHPHLIPLFDILEGVGMSGVPSTTAASENEAAHKPSLFDIRIREQAQSQTPMSSSIPNVIEIPRHQELFFPKVFKPSVKLSESQFNKTDIRPVDSSPDRKVDPSAMQFDLGLAKLKKRKLELEIELIEKQIQYQESVLRRDFGTQPSSSNSSANSVPLTTAPTDFTSFFRSFQTTGIKQEPFIFQ